MPTLSELLADVPARYRSRFAREFRNAVISSELSAIEVAERIRLPPATKGGKGKETGDFFILSDTETVTHWTARMTARLTSRAASRGVPTLADLQAGTVDAEQAAQRTRERLLQGRKKSARQGQKRRERDSLTEQQQQDHMTPETGLLTPAEHPEHTDL